MRHTINSEAKTTPLARQLFATTNDMHLVVLRLVLGPIFFAHRAQKIFGWFGGPGYGPIMHWFASQHTPAPLA
jgi:putative oxidoreductase